MRTGRPKVELVLSDEERSQLQSFARSRSLPAALSNRARIVLSSADGRLHVAGVATDQEGGTRARELGQLGDRVADLGDLLLELCLGDHGLRDWLLALASTRCWAWNRLARIIDR